MGLFFSKSLTVVVGMIISAAQTLLIVCPRSSTSTTVIHCKFSNSSQFTTHKLVNPVTPTDIYITNQLTFDKTLCITLLLLLNLLCVQVLVQLLCGHDDQRVCLLLGQSMIERKRATSG